MVIPKLKRHDDVVSRKRAIAIDNRMAEWRHPGNRPGSDSQRGTFFVDWKSRGPPGWRCGSSSPRRSQLAIAGHNIMLVQLTPFKDTPNYLRVRREAIRKPGIRNLPSLPILRLSRDSSCGITQHSLTK